jgi:2-polyprenyl-3-methyl-5-hydroxy-6-metoxy-1,4-benzoquinol methylase
MDHGKYHVDQELYEKLVAQLYENNAPVTLGPEYGDFIANNVLQLFIRLARYKFVARMVKPRDDVLEVGCGSGLGAIFLGQHARRVTGLEIKAHELAEAESINRRSNVRFIQGDFFEYQPDFAPDVVVSLDVLEHLEPAVGEKFVALMARVLDTAGMAIIGTPSIHSYPYQGPLSKASHVKCYDQAELVALAERHFRRTLVFSMNDEMVHTGFGKLAWYYIVICLLPR